MLTGNADGQQVCSRWVDVQVGAGASARLFDSQHTAAVTHDRVEQIYCHRGTVSGKLYIKDGPLNPWQDCSTAGMGGRAIPGSIPIDAMGLRCVYRGGK